MNVISYINGDSKITDYPQCSARPLSRMVQALNDCLAGPDGYLSPENSVVVLDLGWSTVGTAGTSREVVWRWLSDLLVDPVHGVVKHPSRPESTAVIRRVAELCMRQAIGEQVSVTEWREARTAAAADVYVDAYTYAASAAAAYADAYAYAYVAAAAAAFAAVDAYVDAYVDADADAAARIEFTRWAITRWREIAGLDEASDINLAAVDSALTRINA